MSKPKKPLSLDDFEAKLLAMDDTITRSLAPAPDPLEGIEYTGNPETDSTAELTAMQLAFRERNKNESNRFELATDSEFWVALCFQTRDQKEAFLKALDLIKHGDKYLEGRLLAEKLGIPLPTETPIYNASEKVDRRYAELAGGY